MLVGGKSGGWLSSLFLVFMGGMFLYILPQLDKGGERIIAVLFSATCWWLLYSRIQNGKEAAQFEKWLTKNRSKLENNEAVYYGSKRVALDTELIRFHIVYSFFVISIRHASRWFIVGKEPIEGVRSGYIICTFILGWWGFPFGPIWTFQALIKNANGGSKTTIRQLLAPAEKLNVMQQALKSTADSLVIR